MLVVVVMMMRKMKRIAFAGVCRCNGCWAWCWHDDGVGCQTVGHGVDRKWKLICVDWDGRWKRWNGRRWRCIDRHGRVIEVGVLLRRSEQGARICCQRVMRMVGHGYMRRTSSRLSHWWWRWEMRNVGWGGGRWSRVRRRTRRVCPGNVGQTGRNRLIQEDWDWGLLELGFIGKKEKKFIVKLSFNWFAYLLYLLKLSNLLSSSKLTRVRCPFLQSFLQSTYVQRSWTHSHQFHNFQKFSFVYIEQLLHIVSPFFIETSGWIRNLLYSFIIDDLIRMKKNITLTNEGVIVGKKVGSLQNPVQL